MFASWDGVESGSEVRFDYCVAGGGPTGISIALELERLTAGKARICLLEGGGLQPDAISDEHPYQGANIGRPYSLTASRLRFFGGSTNHWGGWCRTMDAIDFEKKDYIPYSGWPIDKADVDPYYARAIALCEIPRSVAELPAHERARPEYWHHYDEELVTKDFFFSPPTRFGLRYRKDIASSESIHCFLNTAAVEAIRTGRRIESFRAVHNGRQFQIAADRYVLAMGGIENARFLLNSNRQDERGLGNESGLVGRFFADHLGRTFIRVLTTTALPYLSQRIVVEGERAMPHLSFSDSLLLRERLVNFGMVFIPVERRTLVNADFFFDEDLYPVPWRNFEFRLFEGVCRFEPTPNPESRVMLSTEIDPTGMRRVVLDWRVNDYEFQCLERIAVILSMKLGRLNLGRGQRLIVNTPEEQQRAGYQSHQMGTTRMAERPDEGVVDRECRVFSLENLYAAGGSIFPSYGFANPTITIVALAVRLAHHLAGRT